MTSFIVKIKNGYLQTPNISITPTHTKKITLKRIFTNLKITGTAFVCLSPFSNIKKAYLQTSKYLAQLFAYPLFQIFKKHTYKSQNTWHNFFAHPLFQILKKEYLQISKYLAQFFAYPLFQILKKHTYKSPNTWYNFSLIPFFKY